MLETARDDLEKLAAEIRRVSGRLRSMPLARLTDDRVSAVRRVIQLLAELAQGAEERAADGPPRWRTVPALGRHALGDQLAVVGHDLVAALRELRPSDQVWLPAAGRGPAAEALALAQDRLRELKLML
ncbi:hypothetical protein LI90_767 [Carbonactinospora thermoautotrophica]|uniref:Uncharacterized protein n=1 Tax=Carbonactinospora thermoautotrophica TaxID=1469144 RepID=A0A132MMW2_9ACTN|nr:hypothetical protein [Carbonactinospora thermoautotrophica]KWW99133.1 hypothetical protein LI90_767 [Carbonactinospora thermoautotrophica]